MTTLSDLTLKQLTAIYSAVSGKPTGPKYFNMKVTGVSRLEALLAEKNLTLADALNAAGIVEEVPAYPETTPVLEADADNDVIDTTEKEMPEPGIELAVETEPSTALTGADDTAGANNQDFAPEANDYAPVAAAEAYTPDQAGVVAVLGDLARRTVVLEAVRDALKGTGHDEATALATTEWLNTLMAKAIDQPGRRNRQPRTGTKQEIVIALLRRPEGATIEQMMEATGWMSHSCRGYLAGGLKKRLGLTITSSKGADGQRVYQLLP